MNIWRHEGIQSVSTTSHTAEYTVSGMTCAHCVVSVTEEVKELAGVTDVAVDLDGGRLTVTSDRPLIVTEVASAVDEAGYQLT